MKGGVRSGAEPALVQLSLLTCLKRERARNMIRSAFPRRRAHIVSARTAADLEPVLLRGFVDAVIVDAGSGDEAFRFLCRAEEFASIPFFLVTTLLPVDAPSVAHAMESGVRGLIVEGVDDNVVRELITSSAFTTRFERAFSVPPPALALESRLQLAVWQSLVRRGGRPVRTEQLAAELKVSREHLSRSFAVGNAPTLKRVIDLVRVLAAAEFSKNSGLDVRDVAEVLGYASSSHLSSTTQRLIGARASSLSRLRATDIIQRFSRQASVAPHPGLPSAGTL